MRNRCNKGISLLTAVLLLWMTGCGKQSAEEGVPDAVIGSYVETAITLPEEMQHLRIHQIFEQKGTLHLLTSGDDAGAGGFGEWEYDGEIFTDVTPGWMEELPMRPAQNQNIKMLRGTTESADSIEPDYFYASYQEEEQADFKGHLWKAESDGLTEITPKGWQEPNEWGYYDYPADLALTNGILVGNLNNRIETYQTADGQLIHSEEFTQSYTTAIAAWGEQYYLMPTTNGQQASALEIFSLTGGAAVENIPVVQESISYNYISVTPNGDILLGNADGFFRLRQGEKDWEKLMEGIDTSMSGLDVWCQGIAALEDGSFYGIFFDGQQYSLMGYAYDPDAVVAITETLTVYTIKQSFLLQQAAVLFHREHPQVMIKVETAVSQEDEWRGNINYQELTQKLNTELLAGKGADILVMDGLNQESYINNGLLADLDDIVTPLEQSGELLENITGTYVREGGGRYVIPLSFATVLGVARDIQPASMQDIPSLVRLMETGQESLMGPLTPEELLDRFLPYFCSDLIRNREVDEKVLKTHLEYLKVISANSGLLAQRDEEDRAFNIWDIPSRSRLVLEENGGFNSALLPLAVVKLVDGSYTAFDNAFYPLLEVGVNAQSKHVDRAKEFVTFALSQKIQDEDYYQGYPINSQSLEVQSQADRSEAEAYTTIEVGDGGEVGFAIEQYEPEEAARLLEICRTVNRKASIDPVVRDKIAAALPAYLDATVGLEETAKNITGELRMYLQE